jgi:hypothetical protein
MNRGRDRNFPKVNSEQLTRNIRNLPDRFLIKPGSLSNAMKTRIDVALILWNPDVIQLMSWLLLDRNLTSSGVEPSEGAQRVEDLISSCSPSVVVFDLDPPYDLSAAVALRLVDRFSDLSFVLTCADSALALKKAPWLSHHPLFQKPYEMDAMTNTVRSLVRRAKKNVAVLSIGA